MDFFRKIFIKHLVVFSLISLFSLIVIPSNSALETQDRYIVKYKNSAPLISSSSELSSRGMKIEQVLSAVFKGSIGTMTSAQAVAIANLPFIEYVEKDQPVLVNTIYTNPVESSANSWGIDRINQTSLPLNNKYSYLSDGAGVEAYVIDTGILSTHTEFSGRVLTGYSVIADNNGTEDCNGHGTHVAGTIAGSTYGVAKAAKLVPVRVLDCNGSGSTSGVVSGVNWVTQDHKAGELAVANLSLGGGASQALDDAINALVADGVVVAVAAGNSNANACNYSPARAASAITVGATTSSDSRASYSNFGTCLDIFAPGSSITSAWSTGNVATNTISGTSMASPHVAGAAALLLEKSPAATPSQIRSQMLGMSTLNVVTSAGTGSPNVLLATEPATFGMSPARTITFSPITSISNGFTVNITNYDSTFQYQLTVTSGNVTQGIASGSTLPITISGLAAGQSATLAVSVSKVNFFTGNNSVTGSALTTVPSTPVINSVGRGNSKGTINASWSIASSGGAPIIEYTITINQYSSSNSLLTPIKTESRKLSGSSLALSISTQIGSLQSGSWYDISVTARNIVGFSLASALSARVQAR